MKYVEAKDSCIEGKSRIRKREDLEHSTPAISKFQLVPARVASSCVAFVKFIRNACKTGSSMGTGNVTGPSTAKDGFGKSCFLM